ncbi:unnamed protein product [Peniophora sp. CBMAI 1063]|nr:unnamed protein product [Peniophora sp. CBMAI 1063]
MAAVHQFTLRPVDMRDTTSPTRHPAHYGPPPSPSPSSSSSGSSYGGAPSGRTNGHNVHVPDVKLPQGQHGTPMNAAPRAYPPPPTGHDLMRLFPPPPPSQFSELKGGPTSYYFHRQERAFFAQAGREQIRIRLDAEFAPRPSPSTANMPAPASMPSRNWAPPQAPIHPYPSHMPAAPVGPPTSGHAQDVDDDELWRRPTPYNERRRAGKHTKRAIKP